jgi:predicted RNase H-like HicB family nuclease
VPHYVGILDGSGDTWGVRIPDLAGCHGGGETAEAAIADAISAAREWAEHRNAKGAVMPASRPLRQIIRDGELDVQAGETAVMIPLLLDRGGRFARTCRWTPRCLRRSTKRRGPGR